MRYKTKVTVTTQGKVFKPGSILPEDLSKSDLAFLKSKKFVEPADVPAAAYEEPEEDPEDEQEPENGGFDGFNVTEPDGMKNPDEIRKIRSKKEVAAYAKKIGFDYVALGHLHSPQHVGRETVRYCGTPLKYSFSEAEQEKSVTVAELKEKGNVEIRRIPLKPLRDMRRIRGTYMEVTDRSFYQDTNTEDYVQITLTDEEDVPDGLQKLRISGCDRL